MSERDEFYYGKGYADGRKEIAKMLIKRFDPDRPPTSEGAYYYKDEIIEIIKEMAVIVDE